MRVALRHGPAKAQSSRDKNFPAPRRGWIRNESLAKSKPEGASLLDNFFPTSTGCRVRKGCTKFATAGAGDRIGAIMAYDAGSNRKLFAANASAIYDITSPADPNVSPAAAVSGLTSDDYAYLQFSNPGGTYLCVVNGTNPRQLFNGTAWSTPAITGPAFISHIWAFKQRQFFIEPNTMVAWYLAIDAISGAATALPLGGIFKHGGSLMMGATWSYNSGAGLAEACVFITTEGEVAIYEGTDPSAAATWALKGVYRIGRPLGKRGVFKGGGDLAIATDIGLIPLSQAISVDAAAIGGKAISYQIEEEWKAEVIQRRALYSWQTEMWPSQQMVMVAPATYSTLPKITFVVNVRTGAWARYTGWDTQCLGLFGTRMFFGTLTGEIFEAEVGGSDNGAIYTAAYVGLFDDLGYPSRIKTTNLARATFLTTNTTGAKLSMSTDFVVNLPLAPSVAAAATNGNAWNVGLWNQAIWGATVTPVREAIWRSVTSTGGFVAPAVQVSIGGVVEPQIDFVELDITYQVGMTVT